jgi:hypothetical protein
MFWNQQKNKSCLPDSQIVATGCYLDLEPDRSREDDLERPGDLDLPKFKQHELNSIVVKDNSILFRVTHSAGFATIF